MSEVWVTYNMNDDEEGSKFSVEKSRATPFLPSSDKMRYNGILPVKDTKAANMKKIVEKYVRTTRV